MAGIGGILKGAYKYAKEGGIIPSETAAGQLSMLPHDYGRVPKRRPMNERELHRAVMRGIKADYASRPPFPATRRVSAVDGPTRARVKLAARTQELAQKRARAGVKGRSVPGSITPSTPSPRRIGPLSAGEAKVDELFGITWGK